MHLSKKVKMFSEIFNVFLKSTFNFENFEIKVDTHSLCISEVIEAENVVL